MNASGVFSSTTTERPHEFFDYTGKTTAIDYAAEIRFLQTKGVAGLDNGLTADENEILFASRNLPEVVHFLLKGLTTWLT